VDSALHRVPGKARKGRSEEASRLRLQGSDPQKLSLKPVFSASNLIDWNLRSLQAEGKFVRAETRRQLKQDRFSRTTIQVAEQTVHLER